MDKQILVDIKEVKDHPEVPNVRSSIRKSDVSELKKSISEHGLKNPIVIFKHEKEYYLVSGFRRRFALLELINDNPEEDKFIHVPAIVRNYSKDDFIKEALFDNMIENIQREDVSDIDIAERIQKLIKMGNKKEDICKQISKSITWVNDILKFLETATDEVKEEAKAGTISISDAKKIAKLNKDQQPIIARGLAQVNATGTNNEKRELKRDIDEASKIRSHRMPSKVKITQIRNILHELLMPDVFDKMEIKDKILIKSCFSVLDWVLGFTTKQISFDIYLGKYKIRVDKQGHRIKYEEDLNEDDMPKPETEENNDNKDLDIPTGE